MSPFYSIIECLYEEGLKFAQCRHNNPFRLQYFINRAKLRSLQPHATQCYSNLVTFKGMLKTVESFSGETE